MTDFTVPTGIPVASEISLCDNPQAYDMIMMERSSSVSTARNLSRSECRVCNAQQPADECALSRKGVQLVPGVHETFLRQVIRDGKIATQLAQIISHLRLMAANQLAERRHVLRGQGACDELIIFTPGQERFSSVVLAGELVQYQVGDANYERKSGETQDRPGGLLFGDRESH